jgi:hypothetical protein
MSIGRSVGQFQASFTYKSLNQKTAPELMVRASQLRGSGGISPLFPNIPCGSVKK